MDERDITDDNGDPGNGGGSTPPPVLSTVTPDHGPGDTAITLTGTHFGAATASVLFRLPGGPEIAAPITSWKATTIAARVPELSSLGSGGPVEVLVATPGGRSAALTFELHEDSPPSVVAITPTEGIEDVQVTVTGRGFGRSLAGSTLVFATPGTAGITATVLTWSSTAISAQVPALSLLGPAGLKEARVRTPWGQSGPVQFELGELPTIMSVQPSSASPGSLVEIHGRAFGSPEAGEIEIVAAYVGDDSIPTTELRRPMATHLGDWTDSTIAARTPSYASLRTTGDKAIVVTTRWGSASHPFYVTDRGSITAWTRIEPHARADDLDAGLAAGLRAPVYDPLWMIGRQWQMRELDGEDAGSPVIARVQGETAEVGRWKPLGGDAADVPSGPVPLETVVEHEQVLPARGGTTPFDDRRLAAESGLQWLRILGAHLSRPTDIDFYRRHYLSSFGIQPPSDSERGSLDATTVRFLDLVAGRAPDGAQLYVSLQQALPENGARIPAVPPIQGNDRGAFLQAVAAWFHWWGEAFSQGTSGGQSWDSTRMEYSFRLAAETTHGEVVLSAPEYDGRRLDWYSLSLSEAQSLRADPAVASQPAPRPFERAVVPTPVAYPGMPAPRFFEFEDERVAYGGVTAGPTDLLRLLYVEFATVYGNDWFTLPLDGLPAGSLCRIETVKVTDTFGRETIVTPLSDVVDGFRMFDLGSRPDLFFVADALPSTFESSPLEEVLLLRDEVTNLVWGVEHLVSGANGQPLNRAESWQEKRRRLEEQEAVQPPPPEGSPALAYRLSTSVPDYWIPFVLRADTDDGELGGSRWLVRAALRDPVTDDVIGPESELLGRGLQELRMFDEVVGRSGVRLRRQWQYGRGPDGSTHLWRTRRRDSGRGEGSSGLRFDVVERRPD